MEDTGSVPMLQLLDDSEQPLELEAQEEEQRRKREAAVAAEKEFADRSRREAVRYLEEHGIAKVMNRLLIQLLMNRPEKPIAYCVQFLRTNPAELQEPDNALVAQKLAEPGSREYMIKARLPWLFEDLLSGLLVDRPAEPGPWVLAWLRFKKPRYAK
eukprot:RCo032370